MPKADFIETEGTVTRMRGHGFYTVTSGPAPASPKHS
jgi:hypothetical protein